MFQFSGFASLTGCYCFSITGCPIRISSDNRLFAPPRSFSQLITSFIASESLGIHHVLLITFSCFSINSFLPICQWTLYTRILSINVDMLRTRTAIKCKSYSPFYRCFLFPLWTLWRISESNRWPLACKASALANWANPPIAIIVVPRRFELRTPTLSV